MSLSRLSADLCAGAHIRNVSEFGSLVLKAVGREGLCGSSLETFGVLFTKGSAYLLKSSSAYHPSEKFNHEELLSVTVLSWWHSGRRQERQEQEDERI